MPIARRILLRRWRPEARSRVRRSAITRRQDRARANVADVWRPSRCRGALLARERKVLGCLGRNHKLARAHEVQSGVFVEAACPAGARLFWRGTVAGADESVSTDRESHAR